MGEKKIQKTAGGKTGSGVNLPEKHIHSVVNMKAQEALQKLKEGNARFAEGKLAHWDVRERRKELVAGQHPFAQIIDCSDSRTAPEFVFDARLGDLFVSRKAGNFLEKGDLGTLEYGAEHLHIPLIVVMGHQSCGAVAAACASDHAEGNVDFLVKTLQPAVKAGNGNPEAVARENVKLVKEGIRGGSPILRKLEQENKLSILGAYYSLETGKVDFF